VTDRVLSTVKKVLTYQFLVILVITFGFAVVLGEGEARSSILGGLAAFLPNFYFGIRIYKSFGQQPKQMLNAFHKGEAGKFFLTLVVFALIFQLPDIKILPLLVSYVAALSVFWFALLMR